MKHLWQLLQAKSWIAFCLLFCLLISVVNAVSQTIPSTNTTAVGMNAVPDGWTIFNGSPDISNKSYHGGIEPNEWYDSPDNPPNGDTVWVSGSSNERAGIIISDLIIGELYTVSFYMAEMRRDIADDPPELYDGELRVDYREVGSLEGLATIFPFTGLTDNSWSFETVTFKAKAASMEFFFRYLYPPGYMGNYWNISIGENSIERECQDFVISELGFEHAYCRLSDSQSGNGVVFGEATGGTPDYTYFWKNLDTGSGNFGNTMGGLNPGFYAFSVKDVRGCELRDTIYLDSLNPVAAFSVNSDQLNTDYQGTAPVEAIFVNESINYANPNNLNADTAFFWNLNNPIADWQLSNNILETFDTIYKATGQSYTTEVCLTVITNNGCTDTTCKTLHIYEPIIFDEVNVFSPNGDGVNDEFTFEFRSASIAEFNCVIVDRWGIVMHEFNEINGSWNGTDKNGSNCKDGVYFYIYTGKADNKTAVSGQGTIQLVDGAE